MMKWYKHNVKEGENNSWIRFLIRIPAKMWSSLDHAPSHHTISFKLANQHTHINFVTLTKLLFFQTRDLFLLLQVEPVHRSTAESSGQCVFVCVCVCVCMSVCMHSSVCLCVYRCVFSLCPPAVPVSHPPSEACGLQRVAAALPSAYLNSGPCTWCHADSTGLNFVRATHGAYTDRSILFRNHKTINFKTVWTFWCAALVDTCMFSVSVLCVRVVSLSWTRSLCSTPSLWAVTSTGISRAEACSHRHATHTGQHQRHVDKTCQ